MKIETYIDSQGRKMYKCTIGHTTYHRGSEKAIKKAIKNHVPENEKTTGALIKILKTKILFNPLKPKKDGKKEV